MVPGAESRIHDNILTLLRYSCAILFDTSGMTSKILRCQTFAAVPPTVSNGVVLGSQWASAAEREVVPRIWSGRIDYPAVFGCVVDQVLNERRPNDYPISAGSQVAIIGTATMSASRMRLMRT